MRGNGVKQWAYQGRPLYHYSGPQLAGAGPVDDKNVRTLGATRAAFGSGQQNQLAEAGWRRAAYAPNVPTQAGIAFRSLAVANGYGFVVDGSEMAIYLLQGPPQDPAAWTPVYAPEAAKPIGDFSIATRKDGTGQWSYKGNCFTPSMAIFIE